MDEKVREVYEKAVRDLKQYELKYKMTSGDFLAAFESGELPENVDFFRWRTVYVGYRHFLKIHV